MVANAILFHRQCKLYVSLVVVQLPSSFVSRSSGQCPSSSGGMKDGIQATHPPPGASSSLICCSRLSEINSTNLTVGMVSHNVHVSISSSSASSESPWSISRTLAI